MKLIVLITLFIFTGTNYVAAKELSDPVQCISIKNIKYKEIPGPRSGMKSISWKAEVENKCRARVSVELLTRIFDKDDFLVISDKTRAIYKALEKTTVYGKTRESVPEKSGISRADIIIIPSRVHELRKSIKEIEKLKKQNK